MHFRCLALIALAVVSLASTACNDLSRPHEITVKAEPPTPPPAPPAPAQPAPNPAMAAGASAGGPRPPSGGG
ncbi:MAG TPA: hypothetical protein PK156_32120 [Polyangium sp.]|nr:hypothetical protein [Polyangium sp.]